MAVTQPNRAASPRTKPSGPNWEKVPGKDTHNLQWRLAGGQRVVYRVGYRDSAGKQRWRIDGYPSTFETVSEARRARDTVLGARGRGEQVRPNPKLRFEDAAGRWLAGPVATLRPNTRNAYRVCVDVHLRPRFGRHRLDDITADDVARLVADLRASGRAETTISGILQAATQVFQFAQRRLGWVGVNPGSLLERGERPKLSETPERRIYVGDELAQVIAATHEPWRTLFRLAGVVGARESELLGLWWENLDLEDLDAATVTFTHQVDRKGNRVPLKTEESKAKLPLPRSAVLMLLQHKARSVYTGPQKFVFATASGRPLGQRNVLRALYRAQEDARKPDGTPTFPELCERDEHGHLVVDAKNKFVLLNMPRRELPPLPDFHALRHTAAMECDDVEEARHLLRHKNSTVTAAVYRSHFADRQREALRARMEARHAVMEADLEATDGSKAQQPEHGGGGKVVSLQEIGRIAQ